MSAKLALTVTITLAKHTVNMAVMTYLMMEIGKAVDGRTDKIGRDFNGAMYGRMFLNMMLAMLVMETFSFAGRKGMEYAKPALTSCWAMTFAKDSNPHQQLEQLPSNESKCTIL